MFRVSLEARLWIRSDGLAFGSRFSFQNNIWSCRGMKPRGAVLVDRRLRKSSNPFSYTCRRIGTFVPRLLNTKVVLKQAMLHRERVISIKLIKLKFEAQSNRNNSISIYAT
jgi:hypothetical protein